MPIASFAWEADATGIVRWVSEAAVALTGYPREDWLSPGFLLARIPEEDRAAAERHLRDGLERGREHAWHHGFVAADGVRLACLTTIAAAGEGEARRLVGHTIRLAPALTEGGAAPRSVVAPDDLTDVFRRAEASVGAYFARQVHDPSTGRLAFSDERYLAVRGATLSVEFFDVVRRLFRDEAQADRIVRSLLFDVSHGMGLCDARRFRERMGLVDRFERLAAGPVFFAHSGWGVVRLLPESSPSPDDDYLLVYDHLNSFEADAWVNEGRRSAVPVCVMNAGYSSGWCEDSYDLPLVAVEVTCRACGDATCTYVMAPPHRIEDQLAAWRGRRSDVEHREVPAHVGFFSEQRRMEHERAVLLEAEQAARAEAESAVRARDEFLTTASHELRTPLTSLSLATETLLRMVGNEPRRLAEAPADVVTRLLDTVRSQLRRFSTLVATLLDVSRVAEGRLKLHLAEADLATLARDVAAGLRPEAEDAGCTISVDAPAPVRGRWDSVRLEQVVTNLVSNAVHYGSGSPVEVAVRRQGEVAELTVRDRGAGIAPEDQERIWRRGERAVDASTHAGLGLGLFIARALVEAHGGTIGCESARGQGALFRVRLPIAGPPAS